MTAGPRRAGGPAARRALVALAGCLVATACARGGARIARLPEPLPAVDDCARPAPALAAMPDAGAAPAFPVTADPAGRRLVDAAGHPFLVVGDAAWSLIAQLRRDEVDRYLAARRASGFNTLLVSLIEHRFATNAPATIEGVAPFTTPGDFTTPNEAYFAWAEWVLRRAREQGFVVLLVPTYLGYAGSSDGWSAEMEVNGVDTMQGWGRYVATRFASLDNIVWVMGGDADPVHPELTDAVARGIAAVRPAALMTVHTAPESIALERWPERTWLGLNAVYTYTDVQAHAIDAHRRSPMPFILFESFYEGERGDPSPRLVRTQMYQAMLSGASGQVYGNNPVWHFSSGGLRKTVTTWTEALASRGTAAVSTFASLFRSLPWWELSPERGLALVSGGSSARNERPIAAVTCDGRLALVYLPVGAAVTIDLGRLASPTATTWPRASMRWIDPLDGSTATVAGATKPVPLTGTLVVRPPRVNADGGTDWILRIDAT